MLKSSTTLTSNAFATSKKMSRRLRLLFVFKHRLFSNPSTSSVFATEIPLLRSPQQIPPSLFQINSSYLSLFFIRLPKNIFAATNDIKILTIFMLIKLSSNVFATNNKISLAFVSKSFNCRRLRH